MRGEGQGRGGETRQRILLAASRLFRERGIDAVGVDAVMAAAGLTHGGFYAHFPSKEALAAEVAAGSLAGAARRWQALAAEAAGAGASGRRAALSRIVESYLAPAHVAAPGRGCILASLGPEVARRPQARAGVTAALREMIAALASCVPGRRRERAIATLCAMVGAVVLARASDDPVLADEILAAARDAALPR